MGVLFSINSVNAMNMSNYPTFPNAVSMSSYVDDNQLYMNSSDINELFWIESQLESDNKVYR